MLSQSYPESIATLAAGVNPATLRGWRTQGPLTEFKPGAHTARQVLILRLAKELSAAGIPAATFGDMATKVIDQLSTQPNVMIELLHAPAHELRGKAPMLLIWRDAQGAYQHLLARSPDLSGVVRWDVVQLSEIIGPVLRRADQLQADLALAQAKDEESTDAQA
ncbi:hypothetical protein CCC_02933 [Paramagnetospirillum magnetotacticum MS-1]|uniref:Uncharacterized protein n=1 Tax=Paramagnetospirillum magnetotacticum MS-1 TaxID=272627 RepID=A0A0C2YK71_PARME|nr:helix-turn-helix domain-containing protein [Paramagnetospirillum magnetotacticum]KIM00145.1 hypothetical protein CCC_02933 [Paramagnetospirillum magnetotacticum MS-1]